MSTPAPADRCVCCEALRKRLQEAQKDHSTQTKCHKKNPADDLICPITRELPCVPVIAMDGRTYEEEAIKTYFSTQHAKSAPIRSPITNEPMGNALLRAPHIKSLISTLIENDALQGDLAKTWQEKVQEVKEKEAWLEKAHEGFVLAMLKVAEGYSRGVHGFEKDRPKAYRWYQKSHDAGSVKGTARVGEFLVKGLGVQRSFPLGMMYLGQTAKAGSDLAAYLLGHAFAEGKYGMPVNEREAIFWLQKCLGACAHSHMKSVTKVKAKGLLSQLLDEQNHAAGEE
ncbi:Sel1 domain protein repeat-containing protein [Seminavis robusta]|uniref:Sel1 domain protein repeat-containing protein n=1 Tax=Seminavis robusta TaxID=568900 RepID=A0A9N8DB55_9STRA|nr:Sel1 domain protein repeat-containing protein [Seminavis robusta]|eukprot:Sro65_g036930.1 Sel1 domain protein repeat-containing protein (284) ;mRNA; r:118901-119752